MQGSEGATFIKPGEASDVGSYQSETLQDCYFLSSINQLVHSLPQIWNQMVLYTNEQV